MIGQAIPCRCLLTVQRLLLAPTAMMEMAPVLAMCEFILFMEQCSKKNSLLSKTNKTRKLPQSLIHKL